MGFLSIFKRSVRYYFLSPFLYIVLTIFLVLSGYFFYTDLVMYNWMNMGGSMSVVRGFWAYYLNDLRFIFMLMIPAITMQVFAEEKKTGTIELITTYPLKDTEILTGKLMACVLVFLLMLSITFLNVLILGIMWDFSEIASIIAGYFGLFLLGLSLITCGIFISSLTENQVVAAMGTLGVFILFWFFTWNEMIADEQVMQMLLRVSLFDRVFDFFRGVVNTKDIIFFALIICFFFILTLQSMGSRAWRGLK